MLDRRLTYFLAVAREGSFSRAAEALHVAQPAVSRQVALLEAELGVRLLERGPAGVRPTDAGRRLAERGGALADAAAALRDELGAYAGGTRGRVRLGYSTSSGYGTAPHLITALRRRLPDLDLAAGVHPTPALAPAVRGGALDFALVRCAPAEPDLEAVVVRREPLGVLLATAHPLAGRAELCLGDLAEQPLALHDRADNPGHYDLVVGACRAAGFDPRVVTPPTPFDPAYGALVQEHAVCLVAESARSGAPPSLVWRGLRDAPVVEVSLVRRAADTTPAVIRALTALTDEAAACRWT